MTVKHHLNDELMMGYAAGILPEAFDLVVATHLSMCETCSKAVAEYENLGGAMLEDVGVANLSAGSLNSVFAAIDKEPILKPRPKRPSGIFPSALQDYIGGDVEAVKWRKLGMGVKQAILPTSKDASARLLYIEAGCEVPDHGHRGTELTLVLQGAFNDEVDHFGRGDIEIANEDLVHTPRAEPGEACICLAATDAPLKFNALIPRMLQPLFRI